MGEKIFKKNKKTVWIFYFYFLNKIQRPCVDGRWPIKTFY